MSDTIKQYHELSSQLKLKSFEQGSMHFTDSKKYSFDKEEDLQSYINKCKPKQGWICYQSVIWHFTDRKELTNEQLPINKNNGKILTAEFLLDDNTSLHIRMAEQGWGAVKITEEKEGSDLIENSHFLQMPRGKREEDKNRFENVLNYRIGWQCDNEDGYQPRLCRFTGFSRRD